MGSSNDGSGAAQSALYAGQQRSEEPAQKGILGRLFEVLSGGDSQPGAQQAQGEDRLTTAQGAPGLNNLRRLRVEDVAIPKVDIVAVAVDITREDLVAVFREHGFSRVPVYEGNLDHPLGLVLLKDLALQHGFGAGPDFVLRDLVRPLIYAPQSMPAQVLLQKMQRDRVHMALVIDEYGGVDGLVTIEDLIETVIGAIEDEHDEAEGAMWKEEAPGIFLAQSTAPLEEFEAALGLRLRAGEEDEEIDTLGGLVFLRTGRVPAQGEIVIHETGIEFEVVDADPRRIKTVRLRMPGAMSPAAEGAPEPQVQVS